MGNRQRSLDTIICNISVNFNANEKQFNVEISYFNTFVKK